MTGLASASKVRGLRVIDQCKEKCLAQKEKTNVGDCMKFCTGSMTTKKYKGPNGGM